MRRNKPGLADLKKLRQASQPPDPPPAKPARTRKRKSFLAPKMGSDTLNPAARPVKAGSSTEKMVSAPIKGGGALLDETDRQLFRQAMRYVERIKDPNRVLLAPTAPAHEEILRERRLRAAGLEQVQPLKRPAPADAATPPAPPPPPRRKARAGSDAYAPAAHDQDDSRYLKAGHGTDVLKDLKRGKWPIGASLDLHGSTLEDARERFERFLTSCLTHDIKCVRIVHGKGYGSRNGDAVLKTTVRRWLTQIDEVIAYTECAEADGGAGAVQILLK